MQCDSIVSGRWNAGNGAELRMSHREGMSGSFPKTENSARSQAISRNFPPINNLSPKDVISTVRQRAVLVVLLHHVSFTLSLMEPSKTSREK